MNKIMLVGRLAQDPEVRYTKNGKAVASFTIAVNRFSGQGQSESADFIPVVAWENLAEMCGNNLAKGARVLVTGRLQIRSYEANDGQKRRVAEVVADMVAQNFEQSGPRPQAGGAKPAASGGVESLGHDVFPDEEIPF